MFAVPKYRTGRCFSQFCRCMRLRAGSGVALYTHTHTELQKKNQADEIIMHAHKHAQATFVSGIGGQLGVRVVFETSFGFRRLKGL